MAAPSTSGLGIIDSASDPTSPAPHAGSGAHGDITRTAAASARSTAGRAKSSSQVTTSSATPSSIIDAASASTTDIRDVVFARISSTGRPRMPPSALMRSIAAANAIPG
jgi:hypothetical protein